jgi:heme oxygenase
LFKNQSSISLFKISKYIFRVFSALNNNQVWSDGLLIFYEIFKFLEENVPESILPREYYRAEEFEKDLAYYKGEDFWKTYKPRPEVQKYLAHLKKVSEDYPTLLIAYVYHLYMGLLSGGQILQKKRKIAKKISTFSLLKSSVTNNEEDIVYDEDNIEPGTNVTFFQNKSILQLKNSLRKRIDDFVEGFDEDLKQQLIIESKTVFELNNEIIRTVEGVTKQNLKLLLYLVVFFLAIYVFFKMWRV